MSNTVIVRVSVVLWCLGTLACGTAPTPQYYLLGGAEPTTGASAETPTAETLAVIGIGPLKFPDYLDRPQLVIRRGVEVDFLDGHRWAEPLERSFSAALAERVAERTGSDRVLVFPWSPGDGIERRVRGEVLRFDVDAMGRAELVVRWQVQDGEGNVRVPARRSRFSHGAASQEPAGMVEALAATVVAFGDQVVASMERQAGE